MTFETTTDLMPHQVAAIDKLSPIRVGALFMEMGTGKTRTAIELIKRRRHRIDRVAWFCPVSLKETIRREIMKHTNTPSDQIHTFGDKTRANNIPEVFWHIIGIESMSASKRVIFAANTLITENTLAIVDESSYIKGHRSARTDWITRVCERARYRLILTGTPISQGVVDLFAQMRFLSQKILGYRSFYSFARNHLVYSDRFPGKIERSLNTDYLAAKIQPYVYQVTKAECLTLPEKLYETRYCRLTHQQRYIYDLTKEETLANLDPDDWNSIAIFRLFSQLQQIVSGYQKLGGSKVELDNNRPQLLMDIVENIPDHEQVVIWGKYHFDIDSISAALLERYRKEDITFFHGGLSQKQRIDEVNRFKAGARFFVATQASGSHGLNEIMSARYVIFYTNNFKYSERRQAEDRNHRIGQDRNVTYIDMICADTIDERIDTALYEKGNVVASFKREVDKVKNRKGNGLKELIMKL